MSAPLPRPNELAVPVRVEESPARTATVAAEPPIMDDLLRGVWKENPVLVQMLGLCPTLAVTNSVANSIAMGLATLAVLIGSSFLVSALKRFIPNEVRIASYVLIIATFVTLADMTLEALVPNIHKALGAFIALIVVNCIILGRAEAFAAKATVKRSVADAIGMGVGFTIILLLMGSIREVLGAGTFLGLRVMSANYEPWVIMVLPPGGFLTLGIIMLSISVWQQMRAQRASAIRRA